MLQTYLYVDNRWYSQLVLTAVVNCSVDEARDLYDQLATVAPLLLALSASAPIYRGYLADVDARWDIIAGSVDCRTPQERGLEPLTTERMVISKSRYDSISSYLSTSKKECMVLMARSVFITDTNIRRPSQQTSLPRHPFGDGPSGP
jgi:hypothetical protein